MMKKRILPESLCEFTFLSGINCAPDGKSFVVCAHKPDLEANCYSTSLWVHKNDGFQQLTHGGKEKSFTYYGNDKIVFPAIYACDDEKRVAAGELLTVFHVADINTSEVKELFRVPLRNAKAKYLYDQKFLVESFFDNARPDFESMEKSARENALRDYEKESEWVICDEAPFWRDGKGFVNKKRTRLFIFDLETNTLTPVAQPEFDTLTYAVRDDGHKIAYVGETFSRRMRRTKGIWLYDVETGACKMILPDDAYQVSAVTFSGADVVTTAVEWDGFGNWPNHHLCRIDEKTGSVEKLVVHETEDCGCKIVSDCQYGETRILQADKNRICYITSKDNTAYLSSWTDANGKSVMTGEDFCVEDFAISKDSTFCIGVCGDRLQEIYEVCNGKTTQLSHFNDAVGEQYEVSRPELYSIINKDNYRLDGYIMKPVGFEPGKKYPAVLQIHGGPRMAYTPFFHHEMQMLTAAGYFVLYCNPRGSSSRGEEFADLALKHGTIDFQDIMEWVKSAVNATPEIDEARVGVTGGSYGGFMTNWVITHTDYFKAAVSCRSISNIISQFGVSDESPWSGEKSYGGTPYHNAEEMWKVSPLRYAANITTPTLFLQSTEDYRCCLPEAIQMYTAMQYFGVETKMCIFKGECHGLSRTGRPRNRLRRLREILKWMNDHL